MTKIVAYIRVSSDKQGKSGLGLEAQITAVRGYADHHGAEILATYEEVESGKNNDRPELAKALVHAKKMKAVLVIAKLDRLSRDAHFLLGLQKASVQFVAVDMPHADAFTVGIMAMVAQKEREMISARTKAALAAAKARGIQLGNRDPQRLVAARARNTEVAKSRARNLVPIIESIEKAGVTTLQGICEVLEARGVKTPRGGTVWYPAQIARIKTMAA
jgi:DNA invertase Pin-like site-specific DNA recombinase